MKRPMKKAVGFLMAMAYSAALFCAASVTAAAEDTHGNNQGGTTADETWNTYTTSKVLDSVNTVAVFGDQFSLYFEAADCEWNSFKFNPDTIVTMVTKDGNSTRLRGIENIDNIYRIVSGSIMDPIAQSSTSVSEVHTVLEGANATSSGGYIIEEKYSFFCYKDKNGGYGVILPNGTLLEDGKSFDEVMYDKLVTVKDDGTYYYYDLDGNLIKESSTDIGTMYFYDDHTGVSVFLNDGESYYDRTYTIYDPDGNKWNADGYIHSIKSVIGSDGNYYLAIPYDYDSYSYDYLYDYYDAYGKEVSADLFIVEEEEEPEDNSIDYSRQTVTIDTYSDSADKNGIREYVVEDPSGRIVHTYKGRDLGQAEGDGFDKGSPDGLQNYTYKFFNGRLYIATTDGLEILDPYTGDVIARNKDFSYYGFDYMSSEGGHLIMQVGEIVDSDWGTVYQSTGLVLLNLDGTLLSEKYETMKPTAPYTSHTSFIVSRTDPTISEKRYGMISGRGNLVVQLIYKEVYYSDSDISIFTRTNTYQDVFSSPTGKQYASDIKMRGTSYDSIKYYDNYILLLTTDKFSKDKIGAVVIR